MTQTASPTVNQLAHYAERVLAIESDMREQLSSVSAEREAKLDAIRGDSHSPFRNQTGHHQLPADV